MLDDNDKQRGPSEQEFGELRGEVKGIGRALDELRGSNAREHAENGARMERFAAEMRTAVEGKASNEWVREHEDRIRQVEGNWREGKGALRLANVAKGVFYAATPFLIYLLTKGLG
jgi:hypothetical protein